MVDPDLIRQLATGQACHIQHGAAAYAHVIPAPAAPAGRTRPPAPAPAIPPAHGDGPRPAALPPR